MRQNSQDINQVTVYIWFNQSSKIGGHVSLRTYKGGKDNTGYYVSFWPSLSDDANYETDPYRFHRFDSKTSVSYFRTEEYDHIKETKKADKTYHLMHLHVDKVNQEIEKIIVEGGRWDLYGSSILSPILSRWRREKQFNCCGLTLHLLRKGGAILHTHHTISDFIISFKRFSDIFSYFLKIIDSKKESPFFNLMIQADSRGETRNNYNHINIIYDLFFSRRNISDFIVFILFFSIEMQRFLHKNEKDRLFFNISTLALYTALSAYFLYSKTYTPKDVANVVCYLRKVEKNYIPSCIWNYFDPPHKLNGIFSILNRKMMNIFFAMTYAIARFSLIFFYGYIYNEPFSLCKRLLIAILVGTIFGTKHFISLQERRIYICILSGQLLHNILKLLINKKIFLKLFNSEHIFLNFSEKIGNFLYSFSMLGEMRVIKGIYENPKKGSFEYFTNQSEKIIHYLYNNSPLLIFFMYSIFWLSDQLSRPLIQEKKPVLDQANHSSWSSFFSKKSKKILGSTIQLTPFIIGGYISICSTRRISLATRANMPASSNQKITP